jgi:hypothetical protein
MMDPQLMQRQTNVSGVKSGRHSFTISPLHRPHVMAPTSF